MRILFLSRWFPYPPDNGSRIRIFNLLKQLAARHEIALVSFTNEPRENEATKALQRYCTELYTIPYRPFRPNRLSAMVGLLSPRPRSVVDTYNREMEQCVRYVAASFQPDLVIATEIDMAPYALVVDNAKRVLDELQLTVAREAPSKADDHVGRLRRRLTWWKHARYASDILRHFDGCAVVSELEYAQVKHLSAGSTQVNIVPNGVDIAHMSGDFGPPQPNTLIYTGALTFNANLDAMHYFEQEILPLIVARNAEATLKITGSTTGVPTKELPVHPSVTLTGYVTDLRPTVAQSALSVVPLRIGGGTRLKILESLALGTPVVTTSKGLEGLRIASGEGVLVADTPATFADAVLRVLREPQFRQQLSQAGRIAVQSYDWQHIGQSLMSQIDEIMFPRQHDQAQKFPDRYMV